MQNREIKFRVWDKDHKVMYSWNEISIEKDQVFCSDGDIYISYDHCILMQFSGFHDKNGREIYEGDIRVAKYYCGDEEVITYNTMVWDKEYACFSWEGREIPDWADNGVIGNLYENPDLIK